MITIKLILATLTAALLTGAAVLAYQGFADASAETAGLAVPRSGQRPEGTTTRSLGVSAARAYSIGVAAPGLDRRRHADDRGASPRPVSPLDFKVSPTIENPDQVGDTAVSALITSNHVEMLPFTLGCFETYFAKVPARSRERAAATLRLRFQNDSTGNGLVVDSQYDLPASDIDDADFAQCLSLSSYAWELGGPLETDVRELHLRVDIVFDPKPGSDSIQALYSQCMSSFMERHQNTDMDGVFVPDAEFIDCEAQAFQAAVDVPTPDYIVPDGASDPAMTRVIDACVRLLYSMHGTTPEAATDAAVGRVKECLRVARLKTPVIVDDLVIDPR